MGSERMVTRRTVGELGNGFVYQGEQKHTPTPFKPLVYQRTDIPVHSRNLKKMEPILKDAYEARFPMDVIVAPELRINPSDIPLQLEGFARIPVSSLLNQESQAFELQYPNPSSSSTIAFIGSGFDPSVFKLAQEGANVFAVDPIFTTEETLSNNADTTLKRDDHIFDETIELWKKSSRNKRNLQTQIEILNADRQAIHNTVEEYIRAYREGRNGVQFLPDSAHQLTIESAQVDAVYSTRCITAMGIFYDLMATSILEGLRIMKPDGRFELSPWREVAYPIEGFAISKDLAQKAWDINSERIMKLLSELSVNVTFRPNREWEETLILRHTDRSSKLFQNYDKLVQAVTNP